MDPLFKVDLEQYARTFSPRNEIIYRPMDGLRVYERRTIILPPFPENIHEPYATSGFCLGIGIKGILEVSPASL
jgi:hypothetical protein